jgi:hypothetical protein
MATIVSLWYTYADLDTAGEGMRRGRCEVAGVMWYWVLIG